jgi:hypothetical protein
MSFKDERVKLHKDDIVVEHIARFSDSAIGVITDASFNNDEALFQIDSTHAGTITRNGMFYSPRNIADGVKTFTSPYNIPVLVNHDLETEPLGRVVDAEYVDFTKTYKDAALNKLVSRVMRRKKDERLQNNYTTDLYDYLLNEGMLDAYGNTYSGIGAARTYMKITDRVAVQKMKDGRFDTMSVSFSRGNLWCMDCRAYALTDECEHGLMDDNILLPTKHGYIEQSFVNAPADVLAKHSNDVNYPELAFLGAARDHVTHLVQEDGIQYDTIILTSAVQVNDSVTSFQDLPLADRDREWDGNAARQRIQKMTESEEKASSSYKKGFLWFDSDKPENLTSYKFPIADVIDGRLVAIPRAIFTAAGVLEGAMGGTKIPQEEQDKMRSHLDRYYAKMREKFDDPSLQPPWSEEDIHHYEEEEEDQEKDGYKPTSEIATQAKKGLDLRKEFDRGGTEVGVARARDLSNRRQVSADTVRRMKAYFDRHAVDKKAKGSKSSGFWGEDSNPSAGYIAWLLWGGDAGRTWAERIVEQLNNQEDCYLLNEQEEDSALKTKDKKQTEEVVADEAMTEAPEQVEDSQGAEQEVADDSAEDIVSEAADQADAQEVAEDVQEDEVASEEVADEVSEETSEDVQADAQEEEVQADEDASAEEAQADSEESEKPMLIDILSLQAYADAVNAWIDSQEDAERYEAARIDVESIAEDAVFCGPEQSFLVTCQDHVEIGLALLDAHEAPHKEKIESKLKEISFETEEQQDQEQFDVEAIASLSVEQKQEVFDALFAECASDNVEYKKLKQEKMMLALESGASQKQSDSIEQEYEALKQSVKPLLAKAVADSKVVYGEIDKSDVEDKAEDLLASDFEDLKTQFDFYGKMKENNTVEDDSNTSKEVVEDSDTEEKGIPSQQEDSVTKDDLTIKELTQAVGDYEISADIAAFIRDFEED